MASTIRQRLRRFNGTDYDTIHLETETKAITDYPYPSNPNLLDNWYFVGGGSQQGGGQFPINQRNGYVVPPNTSYYADTELTIFENYVGEYTRVKYINETCGELIWSTGVLSGKYVKRSEMVPGYIGTGYGINRWRVAGSTTVVTVYDDYIHVDNCEWGFIQELGELLPSISNQPKTVSFLMRNLSYSASPTDFAVGIMYTDANEVLSKCGGASWGLFSYTRTFAAFDGQFAIGAAAGVGTASFDLKAIKLELGDHQTLAHQDSNGNWVLNEVPNYQEQLVRCQISTADTTDAYANKTNVVDSYYVRPNLLDNWYFVGGGSQQGGGQFPINQRAGWIIKPGSSYWDSMWSGEHISAGYYPATYFADNAWYVVIDGTTYYTTNAGVNVFPGYTGYVYGIDRWKQAVVARLVQEGVVIGDATASDVDILSQPIEFAQELSGKTVTFSAMIADPSGSAAGTTNSVGFLRVFINDVELPTHVKIIGNNYTLTSLTLTLPSFINNAKFEIGAYWGNEFTIKAAKLELGDTQTLAHQDASGSWILNEVPNYQEQLARCQRYQQPCGDSLVQVIGTDILSASFRFSVPMRATPTISLLNSPTIIIHDGVDKSFTPNSIVGSQQTNEYVNFINLIGTYGSQITAGTYKTITFNYLWADANLL